MALVTGGAGAIGAATCKRLAAAGMKVAVVDVRGDAAAKVASAIRNEGDDAEPFTADLISETEIVALVEAVMKRFGRIDLLHNNAVANGVIDKDGDLLSLTVDVWDKMFAVNARAPMLLSRQVVPHMIANGGGVIINTSSGASELPAIDARTAYGPSKGALEVLTRYIALQYGAKGIRCNAILPGVVLTPGMEKMFSQDQLDEMIGRTMMRRFNQPEDIAAMVQFLASDDARQVTGELIRVDGGRP